MIEDTKEGHGTSADFWSLGIFAYVIMTLTTPFFSENRDELFKMILNDPVPWDTVIEIIDSKAMMFIKAVSYNYFLIKKITNQNKNLNVINLDDYKM